MDLSVKNLTHAAERQVFTVLVDGFLKHLDQAENRRDVYLKIVDAAGKFYGKAATPETLDKVRAAIRDPENRWFNFIDRIMSETNPHIIKMLMLNLG